MSSDKKHTVTNIGLTFVLGVIAVASLIGSGVFVFSPPQFITDLSDERIQQLQTEISERGIIGFEAFTSAGQELIRYTYVGEKLPELLDPQEDIGKRTGTSYTKILDSGPQGEQRFELIAYSKPQFIEREDGWHYIEYATVPARIFRQTYLGESVFAFLLPRNVYAADTIYSGSGDGRVSIGGQSSWSAARDATTGDTANYTGISASVSSNAVSGKTTTYGVSRIFLPFVTSTIPISATITEASLVVHATSTILNADNDGDDYITVVQTSQATHTQLVTADFDNIVTTEGIDAGQRKDLTSVSAGDTLTFTLNSTGRGWIAKSGVSSNCSATAGISCFGLREGHDNVNSQIAGIANSALIDTSEATGTVYDPYLSVTYTNFAPWQFDPF